MTSEPPVRTTYRSLPSVSDIFENLPIFLVRAFLRVYPSCIRDGSTTFQGTPIPYITEEFIRACDRIVLSFDFRDLHSFSCTDISTYSRNQKRLTRYDDAVSSIPIASRVGPPTPWLSLESAPRIEPFHQCSSGFRKSAGPLPMTILRDPRQA